MCWYFALDSTVRYHKLTENGFDVAVANIDHVVCTLQSLCSRPGYIHAFWILMPVGETHSQLRRFELRHRIIFFST